MEDRKTKSAEIQFKQIIDSAKQLKFEHDIVVKHTVKTTIFFGLIVVSLFLFPYLDAVGKRVITIAVGAIMILSISTNVVMLVVLKKRWSTVKKMITALNFMDEVLKFSDKSEDAESQNTESAEESIQKEEL